MIPVTKAAEEFSISRRTLNRLLASGQLKRYKRLGDRKVYIDRSRLRQLVKPQVVKA